MSREKIGDLSVAINKLLKEYGEEVRKELDSAIPEIAKDTAKKIQENAKQKGLQKTGAYIRGWKVQTSKNVYGDTEAVVYQKDKPYLPHLLEFGHANRNGGRTQPAEHIKPAEDWAEQEITKRVTEAIG